MTTKHVLSRKLILAKDFEDQKMGWYDWKWWRVAKSPNCAGTTFDSDGKWKHVALGYWFLVKKEKGGVR